MQNPNRVDSFVILNDFKGAVCRIELCFAGQVKNIGEVISPGPSSSDLTQVARLTTSTETSAHDDE